MPRRVVLKISGEALASSASDQTIDAKVVDFLASEIAKATESGELELALVVGGGNIWRGASGELAGMNRANSDIMGMLGTIINALALQDAIENHGRQARVMTAINMDQVAEPYIRRRAVRHLEKGRIVIFAAGMGNPYFTTDTPAAQRAAEIEAEIVLKGTHGGIDGVYTEDPKKNPNAVKYETVSFDEAIQKELRVMDLTAITFCKDNDLPIRVFDLMKTDNLRRALAGEAVGTLVK
ncbi:MAG: UMP kinase [Actinobacteria bacterium]|jgi:uridylate kinase|uniref:Uridylate kinase n=1 Tax=freshwater metagenome TaxID=449393 RepID=A0A6J6VRE8_9ZZZZ|nr:UMP kinase [Actinomycetota bacterium]